MNQVINLKDAEVEFFPRFLPEHTADFLLDYFLKADYWRQDTIKLFGKQVLQPRLTALFGEKGKSYTYSGLTMKPMPFPQEIKPLKEKCEDLIQAEFTTCLVNLYRDGNDSMGWHSDDEKELGPEPVIASVSLGEERVFHLKHKNDTSEKYKIRLPHGSLLIMKGKTQQFWKHQLPKTQKEIGPRVNLTFRKII